LILTLILEQFRQLGHFLDDRPEALLFLVEHLAVMEMLDETVATLQPGVGEHADLQ